VTDEQLERGEEGRCVKTVFDAFLLHPLLAERAVRARARARARPTLSKILEHEPLSLGQAKAADVRYQR